MKKGLIIVNSYSNNTASLNQSERLKEEFGRLGIAIDIKQNNEFLAILGRQTVQTSCLEYDFCVYLDKDKYVSAMLEKAAIRLFNASYAIEVCDDKMTTAIALSGNGINMPETLAGFLCYDSGSKVKKSTISQIESLLSYPLVVKCSYGSLGKFVYLISSRNELAEKMQELISTPHLFQEYIKTSHGKDIRLMYVGGKVVAGMMRKSSGDFRSNIELGGTAEKIVITKELEDIAIKIGKILKLDYFGVDLLFGENNQMLVCEVNSNAFFGGIESTCKVNIAKAYAEYIISEIY